MEEDEAAVVTAMCSLSSVPASVFDCATEFSSSIRKKKRRKIISNISEAKKRKAPFRVVPPRNYAVLPNSDERYSFPSRIIQCLGHGNPEGFRVLMRKMCVPNVLFMCECEAASNPFGPMKRKLVGVDLLADYFSTLLEAAPDAVMALHNIVGHYSRETDEAFLSFVMVTTQTKLLLVVENSIPVSTATTHEIISSSTNKNNSGSSSNSSGDTTNMGDSSEKLTTTDDHHSNSETIDPTTVATETEDCDELGSLVDQMTIFSLTTVAAPKMNCNTAKYFWTINAQHKLTKLCCFFRDDTVLPDEIKEQYCVGGL